MQWTIWLFLCCMVRVATGCVLLDINRIEVTKYVGESVFLPCSCADLQDKPHNLIWIKNTHQQIYPSTSRHSDRIHMFNQDSPGNLSLLISDLTKEDEGLYRCEGWTSSYRYIALTVKGCSLMEKDTTYEIVKSSGESVLLPCSCSSLHVQPESVVWEFIGWRRSQYDSVIRISSTSGPYSGRVQTFNHLSPGNASLLISDLTEEDQGIYTCFLNTEIRGINLLIKDLHPVLPASTSTPEAPPGTQTPVTIEQDIVENGGTKIPLHVFILVAALLLPLLLGGVIFLYMRHKGQNRERTQSGRVQGPNNDSSSTYAVLQHRYNAEQMYSTIGHNTGVQNDSSSTYASLQHGYNAEQMYSTVGQNAGVQATTADYENQSSD